MTTHHATRHTLARLLSVLSVCSCSMATPYFIDFSSGSDAAAGTSTAAPWQHCPGDTNAVSVPAATTVHPGDTFYFRRGVVYNGCLTTPANGTRITTLTAANLTTNGVITSAGTNFPAIGINTSTDWAYIINTDAAGSAILACDEWPISATNAGSLTLLGFGNYVSAAAANSNLLTVEIRRPVRYTSTNNFGSGEACLSGGFSNHFAIHFSQFIRIDYLAARDMSNDVAGGCSNTLYGAFYDNGSLGVGGTNYGISVANCYGSNIFSFVRSDAMDHAVLHSNSVDTPYFIALEGGPFSVCWSNYVTNATSALRGFGACSVIGGNYLINCSRSSSNACSFHADGIGPLFSPGAAPGVNTNGWVIGNTIINTVEGLFLEYNNQGTANWTFANNILVGEKNGGGSGDAGMLLRSAPGSRGLFNTLMGLNGCTGWGDPVELQQQVGGYPASSGIALHGNILDFLDSLSAAVIVQDAASTNGLACDGNVYYVPARATPFGIAGVNSSYAAWQADGWDTTHSLNGVDPQFVQATGSDPTALNLRLSGASPANYNTTYSIPVDTIDPSGALVPANIPRIPGAYYTAANLGPTQCCH